MPIEISNHLNFTKNVGSADETTTGQVDQYATKAEQETRKAEDTLLLTENSQRLHKIHESISELPVVDKQRVADVKQKLTHMGILSNSEEERLKSAATIVDRLFDLEMALEESYAKED